MKRVTLHLPAPLRPLAKGRARLRLQVEGETVADLLAALARDYPELTSALLDEAGEVRRQVMLFIGDDDARQLGGMAAPLQAEVYLVVPLVL